MKMDINPIELKGKWNKGYALDIHTVSSKYLHDDDWGKPIFDTEYTYMGKLIHELKYKNRISAIDEIMTLVIPFLTETWKIHKEVNAILPMPPSKIRGTQPVFELAKKIGESLNIKSYTDVLYRTSNIELKGLTDDEKQKYSDGIILNREPKNKRTILLIDDLYKSGTTANAATRVLKENKNIEKVYLLTMTKTRN